MENMGINSDFWLDRPVFVTGATGLVGHWLVKRLAEAGADVVCLVRDWVPQSELVRSSLIGRVKVVRGDVRDRDVLERARPRLRVKVPMGRQSGLLYAIECGFARRNGRQVVQLRRHPRS